LLSYPAAIPLSSRTLTRLAELLRARRDQRRARWRRLDAGRQALLVLAHLRNGDTYARLATGFGIGTTTAWRYVREAVDLLAALADDLTTTITRVARLAYAILDGTLIGGHHPQVQPLPAVGVPAVVGEDVAGHLEQPQPGGVGRQVQAASPRHGEGLGGDVVGVGLGMGTAEEVAELLFRHAASGRSDTCTST
jgi:hypothetical protein